jgi:uncharacterized Zn finger protein
MMSRYLCDARLFDVGSFTDELKVYQVVIPTDPTVRSTCTCPASTYRPGVDCKHIREVTFTVEDDGYPELLRIEDANKANLIEQAHPDIERMVVDAFAQGFKAGARGFVR